MWETFWFEGNLAWGRIESPEDWERIQVAYIDGPDLSSAQRFDNASSGPYFGFASECRGKETLGEFAEKNGMKI